MRYCIYSLEINGNPDVVKALAGHIKREFRSLSKAREISRSLITLFGDEITVRMLVRKASVGMPSKYEIPSVSTYRYRE